MPRQFESARFVQAVSVGNVSETYVSTRTGYELESDGPLLTVKKGGAETVVPWPNVVFAVPLKAPAPKEKK